MSSRYDGVQAEPSLTDRFPRRAARWKLATKTLEFKRRPLLMGIVNVTPDSFSDGGRFFDAQAAIEQGLRLAAEGAEILDVGGESTRPYSSPVDADEELRRVAPVIKALIRDAGIPLSIDTSKAAVARMAMEAGAEIINDVTALTLDPEMVNVALSYRAGVCAMHMLGSPRTMQDDPDYENVVREVGSYLEHRRDALLEAGVEPPQICLDPGIGFGKTHQHNLTLLARCGQLHELGCPLLVGHSRKAFLARVLGDKQADRTAATVGAALTLARQGVQVVRVHDVSAVRQALLLFEATGGVDGHELQFD